jgi:hypothetical protein
MILKSLNYYSFIKRVMRIPTVLVIAWLGLLLAPVTMVIGHLDSHELSWTRDHISTYAVHALHANWITASMLLFALSFICIGISIIRHHELGRNYLCQIASMILGAVVAGLLLLVCFQETAPSRKVLPRIDFTALRQQSFHEAGLFVFFYGSIAVVLIVGLSVMLKRTNRISRVIGGLIAATGPVAMVAMSHSWPKYVGIIDKSGGIRQRAAFLILWIGALLLMVLLSKSAAKKNASGDGAG